MATIDLIIVAVYILGMFIFAIKLGMKESLDDYLVFSRQAPLLLVIFSIISTWVGIGTTVATAAAAYDTGISLGLSAACGGGLGIFAALKLAPKVKQFGDKHNAYTLADFFAVRYDNKCRTLAALLILLVYLMLTAAQFLGLSALLEVWTGLESEFLIWFTAGSTIIYTAFAGIKSDFYTDGVHFVVMCIVLFFILIPKSYFALGSFQPVLNLDARYFDPFAFGGVSFFVAALIFGCVSVFVTMEIWQRIYASETENVAKKSLVISFFVIILFYIASMYFGLTAKALDLQIESRDQTLFKLMNDLLPSGVLGIGIAGFIAVFVSTINSTIMVASATLTGDFIYPAMAKKSVDSKTKLKFARIATFICGALGLCISLILPDLVALSVNALLMLLIIAPAVVGGFYYKRPGVKSAFYSMLVGTCVLLVSLFFDSETAFVPASFASLVTYILMTFFTKKEMVHD